MAQAKLTFSMENYLEAVYELSAQTGSARVSDIAARMNVSKASVNNAMNVLHQRGLVENERYREIYLTEEGRRIGRLTSQKHLILQTLLQEVMGVDEEQANEDACAMEHVISGVSTERILRFLQQQGLSPLTD
ncbi:MAG TPA: metal-dependent transcriptional regulator [Candidatus Onthomonas avicola]|nr:metal-dependent transcriptional regulator [Candidatus Onthomonas avicola]